MPHSCWCKPVHVVAFVLLLLLLVRTSHAEYICVHSTEGSFAVHGFTAPLYTLDSPCTFPVKALAIFVPYFSPVDRDGFADGFDFTHAVGVPRDDARYWQRTLSRQLAAAGIATLRYDALGIGCQPTEVVPMSKATPERLRQTPFCARPLEILKLNRYHYAAALRAAHQELLKYYPEALVAQTVFIAHSASAFVVSDHLRGNPAWLRSAGFVGISPALFAGIENHRAQQLDRHLRQLDECKASGDACLQDLADKFRSVKGDPNPDLLALKGLGREEMRRRAELVLLPIVQSNIGMWKALDATTWFGDQSSTDMPLRYSAGMMFSEDAPGETLIQLPRKRIIYGDSDWALSVDYQVQQWQWVGGRAEELRILPGLGHALDEADSFGQVSSRGLAAITQAVIEVVAAAQATH